MNKEIEDFLDDMAHAVLFEMCYGVPYYDKNLNKIEYTFIEC